MNDSLPTEPQPAASEPDGALKRLSRYAWPVVGLIVAGIALYLLIRELRHTSLADVVASLGHVPPLHWFGAFAGAGLSYGALAWYDRIALQHLDRHLKWPFIALASFVSYALSHNIGASIFSGAVVRYRAYSVKGLSTAEIGVLVAFTAFTWILGVVMLGGLVLVFHPALALRFLVLPEGVARLIGAGMLLAVVFYVYGSLRGFKPLMIGEFAIHYPKPRIVVRQLIAAPMELLGAAAIVYFCIPDGNPGYVVILGVFLASFSAAVASHAPGGIGILEFLFITALPGVPKADVIAALLIFRFFYLVVPLAISLVVVLAFERQQLVARRDAGET